MVTWIHIKSIVSVWICINNTIHPQETRLSIMYVTDNFLTVGDLPES
jgi:hypothetical protein